MGTVHMAIKSQSTWMRNGPHMTLIQDVLWKKKMEDIILYAENRDWWESGRESLVT